MSELIRSNIFLLAMAGIGLLLLLIWLLGRRHYRACSLLFIRHLEESSAPDAVARVTPTAAGFEADLEPAPDPFARCRVTYRTNAEFNLLAWPLQLLAPSLERLTVQAVLPSAPSANLVWNRGRTPATALGRGEASELWKLHRLDFVEAEYATRGVFTNGVEHFFAELQTRFGPFLGEVYVDADAEPHLSVTINTARFDPAQLHTVLALVQGLGRSSLLG